MPILIFILFTVAISYLALLGFYILSDYPAQLSEQRKFKQACAENDIDTINHLLKKQNFNPNRATINGITGMHVACKFGNSKVIKILLEDSRTKPNQLNNKSQTPFHIACINNQHALVNELLLDERIEINKPYNNNRTPLYSICFAAALGGYQNYKRTIETLLQSARVEVNTADNEYGWTPLILASHYGNKDLVKELLAHSKVDQHQTANDGHTTAASTATELGHTNIAKMIK